MSTVGSFDVQGKPALHKHMRVGHRDGRTLAVLCARNSARDPTPHVHFDIAVQGTQFTTSSLNRPISAWFRDTTEIGSRQFRQNVVGNFFAGAIVARSARPPRLLGAFDRAPLH
jgi:hypothetical protein